MKKRKSKTPPRIARVSNWPAFLSRYLSNHRDTKFNWGTHDCCLFTASGVEAIMGFDPTEGVIRGKYKDALSAAKLLKKYGGIEKAAATFCAKYGWPEQPVALAQRGDIVMGDRPEGQSLGICNGMMSAFLGENGIVWNPTLLCSKSWRIK